MTWILLAAALLLASGSGLVLWVLLALDRPLVARGTRLRDEIDERLVEKRAA